jgi:hypothetical protein
LVHLSGGLAWAHRLDIGLLLGEDQGSRLSSDDKGSRLLGDNQGSSESDEQNERDYRF